MDQRKVRKRFHAQSYYDDIISLNSGLVLFLDEKQTISIHP